MARILILNSREGGVVAPLFAILLVSLLSVLALVIDQGYSYLTQRKVQNAVDAASFAAVAQLPATSDSEVINEAIAVAGLNQVSSTQLTDVECGVWNTTAKSFSRCCMAGCPCSACSSPSTNAVRVRGRQPFSTYFAKLLGVSTLSGSAESVSYRPSAPLCLPPFGIMSSRISNSLAPGQTFWSGSYSAGNWGKLDPDGTINGNPAFVAAMLGTTCLPTPSTGSVVDTGTGFAGVDSAFSTLLSTGKNLGMIVPVTSSFSNGSGTVQVLEYVRVDYVGDNGRSGRNWEGNFRLVERNPALTSSSMSAGRTLVK